MLRDPVFGLRRHAARPGRLVWSWIHHLGLRHRPCYERSGEPCRKCVKLHRVHQRPLTRESAGRKQESCARDEGSYPERMGKSLTVPQPRSWRSASVNESLDVLYSAAEDRANSAINWYMEQRRGRAWLSKALRGATLGCVGLGTLMPLLAAAQGASPWLEFAVAGSWGYVFLALAGSCVLVDRYFGVSSAWIRFVSAGLALQQLLHRFRLDWASALSRLGNREPSPEELNSLLEMLSKFGAAVEREIERETNAWVAEFQSGLAELSRLAQERTSSPAPRPPSADALSEVPASTAAGPTARSTSGEYPAAPSKQEVQVKAVAQQHGKA